MAASLRIAVTGANGQLARALLERAAAHGVAVVAVGRPALDLAVSHSVLPALADAAPDVVVNAAAYTAVDLAEREPDVAAAINERGAGAVAAAARDLRVPIVHISTDYVFDGTAAAAYREGDPVAPLSAYGRSKLGGERAVAATHAEHAIVRTAWVYSPFGQNFVKTMLRLAATRDEVGIVGDQHGCPTSALDLADAVIAVARNLAARPQEPALRGVFHAAGRGEATWAGFARAIFAASAARGGPHAAVRTITTADYPTPAPRPRNSRLDCARLAAVHAVELPAWEGSVRACVERLVGELVRDVPGESRGVGS